MERADPCCGTALTDPRDKADCKPSSVPGDVGFTALAFVPRLARMAAIHLDPGLHRDSSGQPGDWPGSCVSLFGLAPDGVCRAPDVTIGAVSSYLTISTLPPISLSATGAVYFLLHFPSGRPAPLLAGILPGGARTFLPDKIGAAARPPCRHGFYSRTGFETATGRLRDPNAGSPRPRRRWQRSSRRGPT